MSLIIYSFLRRFSPVTESGNCYLCRSVWDDIGSIARGPTIRKTEGIIGLPSDL
jgi:hypothetical protein